jgi:hypothetical protein
MKSKKFWDGWPWDSSGRADGDRIATSVAGDYCPRPIDL